MHPRIAIAIVLAGLAARAATPADSLLVEDFSSFDTNTLSHLAGVSFVTNGALHVTLQPSCPYPHVKIRRRADLGRYRRLEAEVTNLGDRGVTVACRVDNENAGGNANQSSGAIALAPGESGVLVVRFNRVSPNGFRETLKGMHAYPDGTGRGPALDPSRIVAIQFFGNRPAHVMRFAVRRITASGLFDPRQLEVPQPFFPFIDALGQYRHGEWPGKTHAPAELPARREREAADLAAHPAPADRDAIGGWKDGPQLEGTGCFRVTKHDGRWWLVTPQGRLFWSLGVNCVGAGAATFVAERDGWFEALPAADSELGRFYRLARCLRGDYKDREMTSFDFGRANLRRKHGTEWEAASRELAHRRLPSWGFNTIGCWSDTKLVAMRRTPYVDWVFHAAPRLRSWGLIRKPFPDVLDPRFALEFRRRAERRLAATKDDPLCIGYFSDNELSWDDEDTLARVVMKTPADQVAKQRMVEWLGKRYDGDIAALNAAWKTAYAGWNEMLPPQDIRSTPGTAGDLADFTEVMARAYFATCRQVLAEIAPGKLYLGCRFATHNPRLVRIAAEYCDVLSFNIYRRTVAAWPVPGDVDRPVLIGEFHFGARDRGVFGDGLVGVENQAARAAAVRRYLRDALEHPCFVGAHWFQYVDEPATGRPLDGENHQIGLVDICDTPHMETIAAFREVGADLYGMRAAGQARPPAKEDRRREPPGAAR
jgi:hypothetical protein